MVKNTLDSEIKRAESVARAIQTRIQMHCMESGMSGGYVKAEALVPMTENINMTFEIDVPYEMMDEDNTALLEYFIGHIYQPKNGSYMEKAIDALAVEKGCGIKRLHENLDNFDAVEFMQRDYDTFHKMDE